MNKIRQFLEAKHHTSPNLEDPEGWLFSVGTSDFPGYAVDFFASQDLGNSVYEMEHNPTKVEHTNKDDGVRAIYDHAQRILADYRYDVDNEEYDRLEDLLERHFERNSSVFLKGIGQENYQFFLIPEIEWDQLHLVALK